MGERSRNDLQNTPTTSVITGQSDANSAPGGTVQAMTRFHIVGESEDVQVLTAHFGQASLLARRLDDASLPFSLEAVEGIIVALGSSGAVAAAAKCILAFLKERK